MSGDTKRDKPNSIIDFSSMHHYRTRFQAKKLREAQEQERFAASMRKFIAEKADVRRLKLQPEELVLKSAELVLEQAEHVLQQAEHHLCPLSSLLNAEEAKQKDLNVAEERNNDVKFIQSLLDLVPRADSQLERTEICVEIFDYFIDHPLLIKTHERFRNVVQQKIIEFQMTIQMERQELKTGPSNRTVYEWKQQAKILGMFDILEELIHRVKAHL